MIHFKRCGIQRFKSIFSPLPTFSDSSCYIDVETILLLQLDLAGIAASHGLACTSGGLEPSPILLNMQIPASLACSSIRFSLSRTTTEQDIDIAIELITQLVKKQKRL